MYIVTEVAIKPIGQKRHAPSLNWWTLCYLKIKLKKKSFTLSTKTKTHLQIFLLSIMYMWKIKAHSLILEHILYHPYNIYIIYNGNSTNCQFKKKLKTLRIQKTLRLFYYIFILKMHFESSFSLKKPFGHQFFFSF